MKSKIISFKRFDRSLVALAVCTACIPAFAQSDAVQGVVSVGAGLLSGSRSDRGLFDQFSAMRKDSDVAGMLDIDYSLRKPDTATWVDFLGTDLLGDTRELNLVWKKVGDWKVVAEYSDLVHNDINQVNTGLVNGGSTQPVVATLTGGAGSGSIFDLQTKRSKLGVGYTKIITPRMQLSIDLKTENKKGSRLFGIGMNCPTSYDLACLGTTAVNVGSATLMLPEPIDSNLTQVEARLSYSLEKLRVSVGYYGSFYRNANNSLSPTVSGDLYNPVVVLLPASASLLGYLNQAVSLTPDNQSHQVDLTGNYAFSDKTRGTFKLAYSTAEQDDGFAGTSRTGLTSLGGKVNTSMAQLGVTSRPIPKLSLLADVRYFNKDDLTPISAYNIAGTTPFTNQNLSSLKTNAKVQASWQFNSDYRGTLGADYAMIDRGVLTATSAVGGITALRETTDETGVRAELRRRLSENLSGSVALSSSKREGSNWLKDNSGPGVTESTNLSDPAFVNGIFMPTLADRKRDKVKIYADWMPSKALAFQFSAEEGTDKYTSPSLYGLHDTHMNSLGVDWTYAVSFRLQLNGYLSTGTQSLNQSRYGAALMAFDNRSTNLGLGFTAKPNNQWDLGGGLSFVDDTSKYAQSLDGSADAYTVASLAASGGLPDIVFRQTSLKLFGKYAIDKKSAVRFDFVHQQSSYNDWTWGYNGVPYTYSDGTTLQQQADQTVDFLGVTYLYRFN